MRGSDPPPRWIVGAAFIEKRDGTFNLSAPVLKGYGSSRHHPSPSVLDSHSECLVLDFADLSTILPADFLASARHDRHRVTTLPLSIRNHVARKDAASSEVAI
jgi:hypothetical protein